MSSGTQTGDIGIGGAALFACGSLLMALTVLSGCGESSRVLELASGLVADVSETVATASGLEGSSVVAVLEDFLRDGPTDRAEAEREPNGDSRTYYQYIDESGSVRFVSSLYEVPEQWRDRAGSVELTSPPPLRPADRAAEFERRRERARAVLAAAAPARLRSNVDVQLYYASWCGYCRKAKAHLDELGIDYVLRDVDDPDTKAELIARTGSGSIPVLDVGGEFVRGYNAAAIDRLLAKL